MATVSSIQFRRGSKATLEAKLVVGQLGVPLKGEPIFEVDTQKLKIGDGSTPYANLPYIGREGGGGGSDLTADGKSIQITNDVISLFGYSTAATGAVIRKTADGVEWVEVCTKAEVEALINEHHDSTKQDVISDLETIRSGAELGATALQAVPEEYAKKTDIPTVPTKVSELENDEGYLTEHQSLADYSTTEEMNTAIANHHDDDKQDIISDLESIRSGAELGATALQEVPDTYAKKTDLPTKTSDLTNDSGFLTEHQSLADYSTTAQMNQAIADHHDDTKQDTLDSYIKTAAVEGNKLTLTKQDDTTVEFTGGNTDVYSLVKDTESGDYAAVYHLTKNNENIGEAINIPKDMVVESGSVKTCTEADKPVAGYVVGDKYIDLVIANKTSSHLYIKVSDLIDVYTEGNGIKIENNQISVDTTVIATKSSVEAKQDTISDLADIREGAALGKTALQSFTEEDPTVPAHVKSITEDDITSWNAKSEFSGSYNDLTDKPDIPSIEGLATETYVNEHHDDTKQDTIDDLETIRSGAELGATALQSVPDEYATKADLPTSVSELANDTGYITFDDIPPIPTNTSDLNNDSGYITSSDLPYVPTNVSELDNDAEYQTAADVSTALADYAKSEDLANKQDKLTAGSNITIVKNTETGETVISAIGGEGTKEYTAGSGISISGNTISIIQKYVDYLEKQTYVKPTISTFAITGSGTYETTQSVKVSSFKHKETNIDNISTLAFYKGSTKITDVTPNTSETTIAITEDTISSGTTFYLKGTDTMNNAISSSVSFTFNTYAYTKVTTAEEVPTSGLTKQAEINSFASNGANITYTKGDYIYFYTTKQNAILETYVSGTWAGVDKESYDDPVSITLACGNTKDYYVYRIQIKMGSGTAKYRIR